MHMTRVHLPWCKTLCFIILLLIIIIFNAWERARGDTSYIVGLAAPPRRATDTENCAIVTHIIQYYIVLVLFAPIFATVTALAGSVITKIAFIIRAYLFFYCNGRRRLVRDYFAIHSRVHSVLYRSVSDWTRFFCSALLIIMLSVQGVSRRFSLSRYRVCD